MQCPSPQTPRSAASATDRRYPAGTAISARKGGGRDGEDDGTRTRNHRRDRPVL